MSSSGVGETTPALSIFENSVEAGAFFSSIPFNANESISSMGTLLAHSQILGKLAEDRAKTVAESVSTPSVARDMVAMMDAFGQEKLQYWGFSCVNSSLVR